MFQGRQAWMRRRSDRSRLISWLVFRHIGSSSSGKSSKIEFLRCSVSFQRGNLLGLVNMKAFCKLRHPLALQLIIFFFFISKCSDATENSKKILKMMIRISAYPQVSMILTNPGYQSSIVAYIFDTFDVKGSFISGKSVRIFSSARTIPLQLGCTI